MKNSIIYFLLSIMLLKNISFAKQNLRFGTDATYSPFEFISCNNEIKGFDIDIVHALCKNMQIQCTIINQSFDSLIPSLMFNKIDAVIAGMHITKDRLKQVNFTNPYYTNYAVFVAKKEKKYKNISILFKKRIGIQNGSVHQKYLYQTYPNMILISYDSYLDAILDLRNNRLDSIFGDYTVINEWLKNDIHLAIVGDKISDINYFGIGLGIATNRNNKKLINELNQAIKNIKNNGQYDKIIMKWFNNQ